MTALKEAKPRVVTIRDRRHPELDLTFRRDIDVTL